MIKNLLIKSASHPYHIIICKHTKGMPTADIPTGTQKYMVMKQFMLMRYNSSSTYSNQFKLHFTNCSIVINVING